LLNLEVVFLVSFNCKRFFMCSRWQ